MRRIEVRAAITVAKSVAGGGTVGFKATARNTDQSIRRSGSGVDLGLGSAGFEFVWSADPNTTSIGSGTDRLHRPVVLSATAAFATREIRAMAGMRPG